MLNVFVKINGETYYLWRAVDHESVVLEAFVSKRREEKAALALLKKIMKLYAKPQVVVNDRLRSYRTATRLTVEGDRPSDAAIDRMEHSATMPRDISSRSANVKANFDRRRDTPSSPGYVLLSHPDICSGDQFNRNLLDTARRSHGNPTNLHRLGRSV